MKNMKVSKLFKILIILLAIAISTNCFVTETFAAGYDVSGKFKGTENPTGSTQLKKVLGTVLNVVRLIGTGVAIIILIIVGAKFMMAAPNERANIKQYCINYVIGAFILIGASGILGIIKTFAQGTITAQGG